MNQQLSYYDAQRALITVQQSQVAAYAFDGNPNNLQQGEPVSIRASILEKMFGLQDFLILKANRPELDNYDLQNWKSALEYVLGKGIQHHGKTYRLAGASASLKDGKFWMAEESLIPKLHRYFKSSQEALSYFGIFTSSCYHGIWKLDHCIRVVVDGNEDTGDGMGFIPKVLLEQLNLPRKQIQVRFVGEGHWLGKGTLLPYEGAEIILPESMLKGAGIPDGKSYWIGIRDIAEPRRFKSNFTVAQWFDEQVHESLRPVVDEKLRTIEEAFESPEKALVFLGQTAMWDAGQGDYADKDARTVIESFLKAGLSTRHRYVHNKLKELSRKAYVELASGGGIELSGRMMAYANLADNVVCIPGANPGKLVISRYPIRDKASFLLMENIPNAIPNGLTGSVYMNDKVAKQIDGDFDGDYAIVCTQKPVVDAVESQAWLLNYQRQDAPPKSRKNDPLNLLPFTASESVGNNIGHITYLIAGCVAEKQEQYIPGLSAQLQAEVQKLKWSTQADWNVIKEVQQKVTIPDYYNRFKSDKRFFVSEAEPLKYADVVAGNTNYVIEHWKNLDSIPEPLIHFRPLIPLWSNEQVPELMPEVKAVVGYYHKWIGRILEKHPDPDQKLIQPAIEFLRNWADSKTDYRQAYAVATWNVVHESRSMLSTGSAVFHAFPEETIKLLQASNGGSVQINPAKSDKTNASAFQYRGKTYHQIKKEQPLVLSSKNREPANRQVLPIVGGYYKQPGATKSNQLDQFRNKINQLQMPTTIQVKREEEQTLFYHNDLCLGQLPRDHDFYGRLTPGLEFSAHLTLKQKTVYLMLQNKEVQYVS